MSDETKGVFLIVGMCFAMAIITHWFLYLMLG